MPFGTNQASQNEKGWGGQVFLRGGGTIPFGTTYSTTQTVYVPLDGNLAWEGVIPAGFSLAAQAMGTCSIASGSNIKISLGLLDLSPAVGNAIVACDEQQLIIPSSASQVAWGLNYVWIGDNLPHIVVIGFKTSNASNAAQVLNDTAAHTPSLLIQMMPTNLQSGLTGAGSAKAPWL